MKTPSQHFKEKVIGKIIVIPFFADGQEYEKEVIAIDLTKDGKKLYICNTWYKEYKHVPHLVSEDFVKEFIKF